MNNIRTERIGMNERNMSNAANRLVAGRGLISRLYDSITFSVGGYITIDLNISLL